MDIIEVLKIVIIGIVEGITEWLPVSSTGHLLLLDSIMPLSSSEKFKEMFFVVIQLGAILAVIGTFWKKICPIGFSNKEDISIEENEEEKKELNKEKKSENGKKRFFIKKDVFVLWFKIIVACLPSAVGIFLDDFLEENFGTPIVIAFMLIIYGILFIVIENWNKKRRPTVNSLEELGYKTAFIIGIFQVLAMIPGTSRSGATIIGALLIGVSRLVAAEFTFFLAVPTMLAASGLKILKFGLAFSTLEIVTLLLGMIVAFIVSIIAIKFLIKYIKNKDFKVFGWYRMVLGIIVILLASVGIIQG